MQSPACKSSAEQENSALQPLLVGIEGFAKPDTISPILLRREDCASTQVHQANDATNPVSGRRRSDADSSFWDNAYRLEAPGTLAAGRRNRRVFRTIRLN